MLIQKQHALVQSFWQPKLLKQQFARQASRSPQAATHRVTQAICFTGEGDLAKEAFSSRRKEKFAPITFSLCLPTGFGDHVRVVGSHSSLGGWEVEGAPLLEWTEGHVWTATIGLPASEVEFKFVHIKPGSPPIWEESANRSLAVQEGKSHALLTSWGSVLDGFQLTEIVKDSTAVHDMDCHAANLEGMQADADRTSLESKMKSPSTHSSSTTTTTNKSDATGFQAATRIQPPKAATSVQEPAVPDSEAVQQLGDGVQEFVDAPFPEADANYDADVESMWGSLEDVSPGIARDHASTTDSQPRTVVSGPTYSTSSLDPSVAAADSDHASTTSEQEEVRYGNLPVCIQTSAHGHAAAQGMPSNAEISLRRLNASPLFKRVGGTASSTAYGIASGALMSAFACLDLAAEDMPVAPEAHLSSLVEAAKQKQEEAPAAD